MRLLLVEDDPLIAVSLRSALSAGGYAIDHAETVAHARLFAAQELYAVAVLDLGLPDGDGTELIREWRRDGHRLPVLVLTVRDGWQDKVRGLRAGADDYMVKPFHPEELLARLEALLRRAPGLHPEPLRINGFELDPGTQSVTDAFGKRLELTGTEFRLLRLFMHQRDRVLSKDFLTEQLYALDTLPDSNLIEVYVRRLRAKLGREVIRTLRGQGYVFPSRAP